MDTAQNSNTNANLIGVPLDLGAQNLGVDIGPDAFRHSGILEKLSSAGLTVKDLGDAKIAERNEVEPGNPRLRYLTEIVRVSEDTASKVEQTIKDGSKAIVLGGDHSISLGSISGASTAVNGDLGLIYIDAHGDLNTDETTLTGNIHGMILASLLGFGAPELKNVHGENVKVKPSNLLLVSGSDFDQPELDLIERENIQSFTLFDLPTKSMGPLLELIDELSSRTKNIWVSLDLDSIDRIYAPAAGMPNAKGLTYREISAIAEYIGKKCNVVGVDVVEYNPLQDEEHKTAELGIELIATFFGKQYSWYSNYLKDNKV